MMTCLSMEPMCLSHGRQRQVERDPQKRDRWRGMIQYPLSCIWSPTQESGSAPGTSCCIVSFVLIAQQGKDHELCCEVDCRYREDGSVA
jgi:hypothetical protein